MDELMKSYEDSNYLGDQDRQLYEEIKRTERQ